MPPISEDRALRIAKAHACTRCGEYSFKQLRVKPAAAGHREELGAAWVATRTCGVCGAHEELGIDDDGDVVYAG